MQFSVSNDFEILERIGAREGQSSRVFRVRHLLLGYECVAKLVNLAIVTAEGGDPLQEARILQAISHANVCEILGAGTIQAPELHQEEAASRPDLQLQSSPLTHLAMLLPFYAGGSLTSRLREGPLSVLEAVTLLLQTLKALEVVHAQGVLHLDLKPSNLLFRADGRLVLSDFGQSVRCDERGMAGGPAYAYQMCMPPEFYSPDRKLTTASDVYFAGCLAYRLLNGENFWNEAVHRATLLKGLVRSIREGSFPDRTFYMPHVPPALRRVVNRALSLDPAARPESAAEFGRVLSRTRGDRSWAGQQIAPERYKMINATRELEVLKRDGLWHLNARTFTTRQQAFEAARRAIATG